jgi:glutamate-ammonia-ligase adenylyltransferase
VRETGEDLSRLAEIVLRLACERARQELGTAGSPLVVLALGKLGGRELLYGSDLDLVFLCADEASRTKASGMARRVTSLLGSPGAHGKLYEVDLRLRPGGVSGELVATPGGFRDYFERGLGQVWERMAWTRARPVAGPPALCEEIAAKVAEVVHAPGFSPADAAAMKEMREKLARAAAPDSIKRSRWGGVVDVEFVAQMHSLARGGGDGRFREGNVPRLLQLLEEAGGIETQPALDLRTAYGFLLSLESRIRIVADLPEDRLPEDPHPLRTLARRLGYVDTAVARAEDGLREEYAYHREVAAHAFARAVAAFSR